MQRFWMGAALAAVGMAVGAAQAQAPKQRPVSDFVKNATYSNVKISPNGEYLAMTVDRGEQDVLTVMTTADLKVVKVTVLPDEKSVGAFYWTSPDRLLFNSIRKQGGYMQPFATGEWYAVNADGSQPRPLIFYGTRDATQKGKQVGNERFSLLDTLPDDDTNVVMAANYARSNSGAGTEIVLLDTLTGRRKSLARAPRDNCSISLDGRKEPRFAVCFDDEDENGGYDQRTELYRRDGTAWTLLNASKSGGKHLSVLNTTSDGTVYAEESDGKSPAAIGTLDPSSGAFKSLYQEKVADISDEMLIWSADEERLLGVVTEAGAPSVHLLDVEHPDLAIYESLAGAFEGQFVNFSSATKDGSKIVVSVRSDTNPGELYLYDRASGKARFLMQSRSWIDPKEMASVKPFVFTSRDGKQVHGYLTIPKGSTGKDMPLIVNPHGGPIGPRDHWGFNPEAQLFANRGYATLQVNFRGSEGYGRAWQDAGHGEWGQGIQNDILDATQWAIDKGYADKDRVCIFGGSFGGYSALMAPAREPTRFKCAVGYVGIYDMDMMFEKGDIPQRESGKRYLRRTLGTDAAVRKSISPVALVDRINIPVMLVAGARDVRAVPEQTEAMRDALVRAGKPPEEVIIQSGEMHGFYKDENKFNLYTKMLAFFDKYIGPHGKVTAGPAGSAGR